MAQRAHHVQTKAVAVFGTAVVAVLLTLGAAGVVGSRGPAAPAMRGATVPAQYLPFLAGQENPSILQGAAAGLVALPDPWAVPPAYLRFLGGGK